MTTIPIIETRIEQAKRTIAQLEAEKVELECHVARLQYQLFGRFEDDPRAVYETMPDVY